MTKKQKDFCDYYIISPNATQAAIKAGYKKKTAYSIGHENLKKPEIKKYLRDIMEKKKKENSISQDEIIEYLTNVVKGKETETRFFVVDGTLIERKVEYAGKDKIKSAELLGKRHNTWSPDKQDEDTDIEVTIEGEDD